MKYDDDRDSRREGIGDRLTFLLIGGGMGAILALLFAPKSGQELRSDIADATRKGIDRSREAAQKLGRRTGEYYPDPPDHVAEDFEVPVNQGGSALPGGEDFPEPSARGWDE